MILKIGASLRCRLSLKCISICVIRNVCCWVDGFKEGSEGKRLCVGYWTRVLTSGIGDMDGPKEQALRSVLPSGGRVLNVLSNKGSDWHGRSCEHRGL